MHVANMKRPDHFRFEKCLVNMFLFFVIFCFLDTSQYQFSNFFEIQYFLIFSVTALILQIEYFIFTG